jgi:hypothetical protein
MMIVLRSVRLDPLDPESTTFVHLSMSAAMRALNASGLDGLGSLPTLVPYREMLMKKSRCPTGTGSNRSGA